MTGTRQTFFSKNPVGFVTAEGIVTRPIPPSAVSHYQPNKINQLFYLSRKTVLLRSCHQQITS